MDIGEFNDKGNSAIGDGELASHPGRVEITLVDPCYGKSEITAGLMGHLACIQTKNC